MPKSGILSKRVLSNHLKNEVPTTTDPLKQQQQQQQQQQKLRDAENRVLDRFSHIQSLCQQFQAETNRLLPIDQLEAKGRELNISIDHSFIHSFIRTYRLV